MRHACILLCCIASAPAGAEIKSMTDQGFEVSKTVIVKADPKHVYETLGKPGLWWSSAHTYSGDAKNMTMVLKAGGCFCEAIPKSGGEVEHGRVVYAQPGQALRLSSALGPLQGEGVAGSLTWSLKKVEGGTEITQSYVVGGYIRGGPKQWASAVDMVTGEQLDRLKALLDSGK